MSKFLITVFLFVQCIALLAQSSNIDVIPKGAVPAPHTAELGKYDHYPVSYFTGVPNISIPLFEVKQGDISVPITLNYHASGIKVSNPGTWVGTGWSLQAGGMISRKLMGRTDEDTGYLTQQIRAASSLNLTQQTDLDYVRLINQGVFDTQPDIFNYNIPGKSGQFIFNKDDTYKPLLIPYEPVLIDRYSVAGSANIRFTIKDERGLIYRLGDVREMTEISNGPNHQSSWNLTEIISPSLIDTVRFAYVQNSGLRSRDISESLTFIDNVNNWTSTTYYSASPIAGYLSNPVSEVYGTESFVNEIKFKSGKVTVTQTNPRQDGFNPGQKSLDKISIYSFDEQSKTYVINKNIAFYYSYFINTDNVTKRLRLDSIQIQDKNSIKIQRYKFAYNPLNLPGVISKAIDYWGYFNNKNNDRLVPRMQIDFGGGPMWIGSSILNGREPDPTYSQACMLNRIDYPTGGYTTFEYEGNAYLDISLPKFAGGLRIKSMSQYASSTAIPLKKTFKYGLNEDGYGRKNFTLNHSFFQTENFRRMLKVITTGGQKTMVADERVRSYISAPSIEIEPHDGSPVVYSVVTEYDGEADGLNGKTVYTFSDPNADVLTTTALCGKPFIKSYHFDRGNLLSKSVYKREANVYKPVFTQQNSYETFLESLHNVGLVVFKRVLSDNADSGNSDVSLGASSGTTDINDSGSYFYVDNVIRSGRKSRLISTTTESHYDQMDQTKILSKTTNYTYGNAVHQMPTAVSKSNSNGEIEQQQITYPHDFPSMMPYSAMVNRNMIAYPVTETILKSGVQLVKKETVYFDWGNNLIAPKEIKVQNSNNPVETEVTYNAYSPNGKPIQAIARDGLPISMMWGYNNSLLVAEVTNAQNSRTTISTQTTATSAITIGGLTPQSTFRTFTVDYTGTVLLKLGVTGTPAFTTYADYSGSFGSGTMTLTNGQICGYNQVSFSNIAPGTYTINITVRASTTGVSVGACGQVEFPDIVSNTTGITEFFNENFEEGTATGVATPHTGKKYLVGDYTTTFIMPNARTYMIEYWYLSGTTWIYATAPYTNGMVLTLGTAIDNVRIYPTDARMKSYTYEPAIGISSVIDENGTVLYYNYDSFGRLWQVKNEKGGIEKQYSYNYKN